MTEDNKNREINGLLEVFDETKLTEGYILTFDQEDEYLINGKKIKVIPVWKWMLAD